MKYDAHRVENEVESKECQLQPWALCEDRVDRSHCKRNEECSSDDKVNLGHLVRVSLPRLLGKVCVLT